MGDSEEAFSIDYERLKDICLRAYSAYENNEGIFRYSESFLPQWKLPSDLEYEPKRIETKFPDLAGNYLWVLASMERRAVTKQNIINGLGTWENPETRWIFDSFEVVDRGLEEVRRVVTDSLNHSFNDYPASLLYNNQLMVNEFGGYARNIVDGMSVEEARKRLMGFKGFGTGIANLFILYCTDRKIASVQDVDRSRVKVDVHKTRIPANTDAVNLSNGRVRRGILTKPLEEAYLAVCKEHGLDAGKLDSALWIIGAKVCARKDFGSCVSLCPLEELCTSRVLENKVTSEIMVYDLEGRRVETRKPTKVQLSLEI